jgi:septum formation protein
VSFRELSHDELARYVATGEGRDKAGSYAIQGIGAFLVSEVQGCYSNVVGLPQSKVVSALCELGALVGYPFADGDER